MASFFIAAEFLMFMESWPSTQITALKSAGQQLKQS